MNKLETEVFQPFLEACDESGLRVGSRDREAINVALTDEHFGFVMQDNLAEATDRLECQEAKIILPDLPLAMGY